MTAHPLDQGLRRLGVDPDTLDPDVLDALRQAKGETVSGADALEALFAQSRQPLTLDTLTNQEPDNHG
jgi:hypothetical protein